MEVKQLSKYMSADIARVESIMRASLGSDIRLLQETNNDVLASGGKRIRPIMAVLVAKALGRCNDDTYLFAAASELIHNASLLHDDVADDASLRRGKPTVSSILGPRASVLLGDLWLVKGIDVILSAQRYGDRVMHGFAKTLSHLSEGEMLQLELARTGRTTEEDYLRVIFDKTASLFEVSAYSAAISAGVPDARVAAAANYARCVGMAFQIKDDIFDYQEASNIGKPVGQDLRERKITLPLLGAFKTKPEHEAEIRKKVCLVPEHPEYIAEIMEYVRDGEGIHYAEKRMQDYLHEAVESLAAFPDCQEKEYLAYVVHYISERTF